MSEGRFPSYHHLPPAAPEPQRHHLTTASTPSLPNLSTFHPPPMSHQLSSFFTKQDMAAYRNTPYASFHNVGALQLHKQHTPIIDRWMDSRNNMPPPSRPGPSSPSPAHSTNVPPNFSMIRTVELDLSKHKNESEHLTIDLSASTHSNNTTSKRTIELIDGQTASCKKKAIEDKTMSVIAPNPLKVIKSEIIGDDSSDCPSSFSVQKMKCTSKSYETKFNKQGEHAKDIVNSPIKIEIAGTNNVEEMLENMFQTNESEKLSVIKTIKPVRSPSPSLMRAESIEKILKSPSPIHRIEHVKFENSSKKNPQLLEIENRLEEMFSEDITSTSIADQQETTENEPKLIVPPKRMYKKNKKQMNKIKKSLPSVDKSKCMVESANKKSKGPLVRINGSNLDNPESFIIINRNVQDDEDLLDGRYINRKSFSYKSGVCNGEEKPDLNNLESSDWQCVFCSRGPHVRDIGYDHPGDLFGPYYVSKPKVIKTNDNPKRKKSKHNINEDDASETFIEVWTHENCLVWSSGVYMVGTKIFGLEDCVRIAKNTVCVYCGTNGASIGCSTRHCKSSIHYSCAIYVGWLLDSQSFMTICNVHRNSILGSSCH